LNPKAIADRTTIHSIFWHCLSKAENTFGQRADGWKYFVKILRSPGPPETIDDGQSKVTVWLNPRRTCAGFYFEAAHEAVHCLDPVVPSGPAMGSVCFRAWRAYG
jgi:hypothetical protein